MISPAHLFQIQELDDHPKQQLDFMLDLGVSDCDIEMFYFRGTPEIEQHNGKYGTASCNGQMYLWVLPEETHALHHKLKTPPSDSGSPRSW